MRVKQKSTLLAGIFCILVCILPADAFIAGSAGIPNGESVTPNQLGEDTGDLKLSGYLLCKDRGMKHVLVRKAIPDDVTSLLSWLNTTSHAKSNLKVYSQDEIERFVHEGNLYLAQDEEDNSLLGSLAMSCPTGSDRTDLLESIAGFPTQIVKELPDLVFYFGALKTNPDFIKNPGKLGDKFCLSVGTQFAVEIARHAIRQKTSEEEATSFALCAGTSLNCLSTMHLALVFRDQVFRAKDLRVLQTLIQEHDIPETQKQRALLTLAVGERDPLWQRQGSKQHEVEVVGSMDGLKIDDILPLTPDEQHLFRLLKANNVPNTLLPPTTMVHGKLRSTICEIVPRNYDEAKYVLKSLYANNVANFSVVSTGKRWGAESAHSVPHIRLNVGALKNIPLLDLSNGVVVVEPGVTQGQLSDILKGTGWTLPVTGSCRHASIIGNAIDGGITSSGLRINQAIGVEAVDMSSGKQVKSGVLATKWSGHGHGLYGLAPANFLFGKQGVVLRMAFVLQRLPKCIAVGVAPGTNDAIRIACELHRDGMLDWWQLRVDEQIGSVVIVKANGSRSHSTKADIEHFYETLGYKGQLVYGETDDDISNAKVDGTGPFPDFFIKAGFDYFRGIPSCDRHHFVLGTASCSEAPSDGHGFRLASFAVPSNPSIISVLRNEITNTGARMGSTDGDKAVSVTLTVTPVSRNTMYFLVWATFDRNSCAAAKSDAFFRSVEKIMKAARCPPCRYNQAGNGPK